MNKSVERKLVLTVDDSIRIAIWLHLNDLIFARKLEMLVSSVAPAIKRISENPSGIVIFI
jgi:hypothetical protein